MIYKRNQQDVLVENIMDISFHGLLCYSQWYSDIFRGESSNTKVYKFQTFKILKYKY